MTRSDLHNTAMFALVAAFAALYLQYAGPDANADAVVLKSGKSTKSSSIPGRVIEGKLVDANDSRIVLETFDGIRTIPTTRVFRHDTKIQSAYEKEYLPALESLGKDAEGQLKLAEMCLKNGGWQRAKEHFQKAVELAPDSKSVADAAQAGLKMADKQEKTRLQKMPRQRPLILNIGVKQDLPKEKVDATDEEVMGPGDGMAANSGWSLGDYVRRTSKLLSDISGRELYIAEVIFTIGSEKGDLVYDENRTDDPATVRIAIEVGPDNWRAAILVHMIGHCKFGIKDCDPSGHGMRDGPCLMAHDWAAGFNEGCQKNLRLGNYSAFVEYAVEEFPEPPITKITVKYAEPKKNDGLDPKANAPRRRPRCRSKDLRAAALLHAKPAVCPAPDCQWRPDGS
jgi:hypothetical protein